MEHYELYCRDVLLGYLDVDEAGRHCYRACAEGVAAVRDRVPLSPVLEKGTDGYVAPMPFFYTRIGHMKQWNLTQINYQTDWYLLRRIG